MKGRNVTEQVYKKTSTALIWQPAFMATVVERSTLSRSKAAHIVVSTWMDDSDA